MRVEIINKLTEINKPKDTNVVPAKRLKKPDDTVGELVRLGATALGSETYMAGRSQE